MNGRDEEFREFMRDRASPLHQSAYLLCGDWHLADDLVQDTLVKAYQHWPRVRQADSPDAYVLHAGTTIAPDGRLVSSGGRVLNVVGTGPDVTAARAAAYAAAARIRMRGGWYRKDIAELAAGGPAAGS